MQQKDLGEVVVTATRTESLSSKVPIPVSVISRKQIDMLGSRRLDEVLREQTGLALVSDVSGGSHGSGLQLQGFDPAYTMIMIDGQPLIGRNSGMLDLSRITIADIERIEIVKGASSCLYGSEALAGVINIITRKPLSAISLNANLRYGTYNTFDAIMEGGLPFHHNKGHISLSGNYYRTDGFNANPDAQQANTVLPYATYTLQARGGYLLNENNRLNLSARWAHLHQHNDYGYISGVTTSDKRSEKDLNIMATLDSRLRDSSTLKTQYYLTRYGTNESIANKTTGAALEDNFFTQYMQGAELQYTNKWFTGGAGGTLESLEATRYSAKRQMQSAFAYMQIDWKIGAQFGILGGLRYDRNNLYGDQLSPKLAVRYTPNHIINFKASVGRGFKAPDFRQSYLSFTNAQVGYTVLGVEEFETGLQRLQDAGEIGNVLPAAASIRSLSPERSTSYNAGFTLTPLRKIKVEMNVFRNDVTDLINTITVAEKTNGWQVYSYVNVSKARMQGLEVNASWQLPYGFSLSGGYQLLYAKNRDVIDSIKSGTGNYASIADSYGQARRSTEKDYYGIENRSRHMGNLRLAYEHKPLGITVSLRANYRGKYGYTDLNGNQFIDEYDRFVKGYTLLNATVGKTFLQNRLSAQLSVDNITGHMNPFIPNLAGRVYTVGIGWKFLKP
ncbi:TonB-dependent receptor [Chitinophaga horti]|uniref:TonB-dependent receptor n=1 Tax=Chitinophaga horti TaxID=2920382 RepID=A0ABY6J0A2_9BACT|nr:TonB-dependent receptor [Chitinophaga horti]UYQ93098.1 TonB-dependent receptor [Chitinophaga horti]